MEHIKKEQMIDFVREISGCLKQNGKLLVMVPNAQSNTGCYWAYEDFTHDYLFTTGSLYYVLAAAGLKDIQFVDIDCFAGAKGWKLPIRKLLLALYRKNRLFWNKVTSSSYYAPSPMVFSYEIKALATKEILSE